jgi:hypothetical protein
MVAVGVLAVTLLLKSTMYFFAIANSFLTFSEFSRSKLFCEVLVTELPCIAPWRREATRALHLRGALHGTSLPHYPIAPLPITSLPHYPIAPLPINSLPIAPFPVTTLPHYPPPISFPKSLFSCII